MAEGVTDVERFESVGAGLESEGYLDRNSPLQPHPSRWPMVSVGQPGPDRRIDAGSSSSTSASGARERCTSGFSAPIACDRRKQSYTATPSVPAMLCPIPVGRNQDQVGPRAHRPRRRRGRRWNARRRALPPEGRNDFARAQDLNVDLASGDRSPCRPRGLSSSRRAHAAGRHECGHQTCRGQGRRSAARRPTSRSRRNAPDFRQCAAEHCVGHALGCAERRPNSAASSSPFTGALGSDISALTSTRSIPSHRRRCEASSRKTLHERAVAVPFDNGLKACP